MVQWDYAIMEEKICTEDEKMEQNAGIKKRFGVQAKLLVFILPLVAVGFLHWS